MNAPLSPDPASRPVDVTDDPPIGFHCVEPIEHMMMEGQPIAPGHYRIRGAAVTPDATVHTEVRDIIVSGS